MQPVVLICVFALLVHSSRLSVLYLTPLFVFGEGFVVADKCNWRRLQARIVNSMQPQDHISQFFATVARRADALDSAAHNLIDVHTRVILMEDDLYSLGGRLQSRFKLFQSLCESGCVDSWGVSQATL